MPIDSFADLADFMLILFGIGLALMAYFFWSWESAVSAKIERLERMLKREVEKK